MLDRIIVVGQIDGWAMRLYSILLDEYAGMIYLPTYQDALAMEELGATDLIILTNDTPDKGEYLYEMLSSLRAKSTTVNIVIMSTWGDLQRAMDAQRRGVNDFVGLDNDSDAVESATEVIDRFGGKRQNSSGQGGLPQ